MTFDVLATHLSASEFEVRDAPFAEARALVVEHHYSRGGSNTGVYVHGLYPDAEETLLGVAWWLPPTKPAAASVSAEHWRTVLALTRLVIVPDMPTNSASFLLGRSIRIIRGLGRWTHLVTWADEGQGHTGAIYRATNWRYAGTGRGDARWIDPITGRHVARLSTKSRTAAQMRDLGYLRTPPTRKHKFVMELSR